MTYGDILVAVAEHCNEHVDEDYHHDGTVCTKHELANKLCEVMVLLQLKVLDINQSIDGKVQRL